MSDKFDKSTESLVLSLFTLAFFVAGIYTEMFTVVKLWGWFIMPHLAVPAISWWQAFTLMFLLRFFWSHDSDTSRHLREIRKDEWTSNERALFECEGAMFYFVRPLIALLMGFLLK